MALTEIDVEPVASADEVPTPFSLANPGRILLATLSAGAGVIHFTMVPSHWAAWPLEGASSLARMIR